MITENLKRALTMPSTSETSFTADAVPFKKMHSLQNDFVLLETAQPVFPQLITHMASRRTGVGCDQLLVIGPAAQSDVHATVKIYNADGSEVEACGNGTRCVVWLLAQKYGLSSIVVETKAGLLKGQVTCERDVEIMQGKPRFLTDEPLDLEAFGLQEGYAVDIGNPHLVVPLDADFDPSRFQYLGPRLESHAFFPNKANVEFVMIDEGCVRLWVWERGVGRTRACASGASAAVFALLKEGLLQNTTTPVKLEGGEMWVTLKADGTITHRAEVNLVFDGTFSL